MGEPNRRQYLKTLGALSVFGVTAGCAGDTGSSSGSTDVPAGESTTGSGGFRLLISDQPVAIGDFDSLDVSFAKARVFRADEEGTDLEDSATPSQTTTQTTVGTANGTRTEDPANDTATEMATTTGTTTMASMNETSSMQDNGTRTDTGDQGGFREIDLDGASVDLTQVVGEKAISVFDGKLQEGRYAKIELVASGIDGIVDGGPVDVMIPSGKLQIVKPFRVIAGETLSFVFDINVVKKGQTGDYNLLPVIAKSGVSGNDVEVEEVDQETDPEETDT